MLGVCRQSGVPIVCSLFGVTVARERWETCACMCTVFGVGRLSDALIARECACVDVDPVREHVQCLAWVA